jgi:hypothetical protein
MSAPGPSLGFRGTCAARAALKRHNCAGWAPLTTFTPRSVLPVHSTA